MKAVIVSAGYGDFLSWTLPANRRFFDKVVVVTTPDDELTISVAAACNAECVTTDVFTKNGAQFAKFEGLELGLDRAGRSGWITIMDADIVMPSDWSWEFLIEGRIHSPFRRMHPHCPPPPESEWRKVPRNSQMPPYHFLGYMQIFHASDKHLGESPWHGSGHLTAARGDMIMMERWPREERVRAPYDVLHLGEARRNWNGRVTPMELIQESPPIEPAVEVRRFPMTYDGLLGESLLFQEELDAIIELMPERGTILEIGTASGVTAAKIADARPTGAVFSIDSYHPYGDGDPYELPMSRLQNWRRNSRPNQSLWVGDVRSFHRQCGVQFDIVFVDGDHSYVGVMTDLLYAKNLIKSGGVILAHDYRNSDWIQVPEAVDKFCAENGFEVERVINTMAVLRKTKLDPMAMLP